ncbi:hypothetical protein [Desulfovibrio inopinatus]|uniref:hypothetical protein n=1 Tax=Desulfovibrio inopinatus TaxID=102109 RepID=UPI0003FC5A1F|nr:hypothetical protein [Desulfovibrio inopinatus]
MNPISQYDTSGNTNARLTRGNTRKNNGGTPAQIQTGYTQDTGSMQSEMMLRARPHLGTRLNLMV